MKAFYWKPEFEWEIRQVLFLSHPRYETIENRALKTTDEGERTIQTHTALIEPEFVLVAEMVKNPYRNKPLLNSYAEAQRRLAEGQCFRQPCLGHNRYPATRFVEAAEDVKPIDLNLNIGRMLFDMIPIDLGNGDGRHPDKLMPVFFDAKVKSGVLDIPEALYAKYRPQVMRVRNTAHPEVSDAS